MEHSVLKELFAAARLAECPIVHVVKLPGEDPFVASSPCLGDAPEALLELSVDEYLRLMAELRDCLVTEKQEILARLNPNAVFGHLDLTWGRAGLCYALESSGVETTILYRGLGSVAEIQAYWLARTALCGDFVAAYGPRSADLAELCRRLDRTVDVASIDLAAFAAERGLGAGVSHALGVG